MTFAKYEFPQAIWQSLKSTITDSEGNAINCAIVEIGELTNGYAVDIMWFGDIPSDFETYEVFPDPVGVHTFSGCDELYTERFCQFNPLSPYCEKP